MRLVVELDLGCVRSIQSEDGELGMARRFERVDIPNELGRFLSGMKICVTLRAASIREQTDIRKSQMFNVTTGAIDLHACAYLFGIVMNRAGMAFDTRGV